MEPTFPTEMEMVGFTLLMKGCTHPTICQSVRGEPFGSAQGERALPSCGGLGLPLVIRLRVGRENRKA
jgi:hypothetical protein